MPTFVVVRNIARAIIRDRMKAERSVKRQETYQTIGELEHVITEAYDDELGILRALFDLD